MNDDTPVLIPGSILALLQHYWRSDQANFSHFEANITDPGRAHVPRFNYYRKDVLKDRGQWSVG